MTTTTISLRAAEAVLQSPQITKRLMARFQLKTPKTVRNWSRTRSDMLTTWDAVDIIQEETRLELDEILEKRQ